MRGLTGSTVDCLVVGLGPAGASAARAASQAGLNVLAVDRKAEAGVPVQCAEFVPIMTGTQVEGLDGMVGQSISAMHTFLDRPQPDVSDTFAGFIIDRERFDRHLVEQACEAGATCRFGEAAQAVEADGSVRLASGKRIVPGLLIGADGPRSNVGAAVGRTNRALAETRQVTVPLNRPHHATDIFLSGRFRAGYAWLFPKGDVANLGLGVDPSIRTDLKPLLEELRAWLIDEGRIGEACWRWTGGAIPVGGLVDPVSALGDMPVLLAGDAAGLANPITGAGIHSAILSGAMAGEAAADWHGGEIGALEDYREEVEDLFGPALARALRRRDGLLSACAGIKGAGSEDLRAGWIAYDEYWAA